MRDLAVRQRTTGPRRVSCFFVDDPIHETISEADTEAKVVVAVAGRVVVALGGAQVRPGVVPGATAFDPVRARCPRLAP